MSLARAVTLARIAAPRASSRTGTLTRASLRRHMSAPAEHGPAKKAGSDWPWIIGAAAVFGPALAYLLGPGAKKTGDHAHHRQGHGLDAKGEHAHNEEHGEGEGSDEGVKDSEGNEASREDVKKSVEQGEKADAPKQAFDAEKKGGSKDSGSAGVPTKDGDGNEADPKEVADSVQKGLDTDAPKSAKAAEEKKK